MANLSHFGGQAGFLQTCERQGEEKGNAPPRVSKGDNEGALAIHVAPFNRRWVRNAPVRSDWLSGLDRADFTGRIVANGEHEIHDRSARIGKLIPAF